MCSLLTSTVIGSISMFTYMIVIQTSCQTEINYPFILKVLDKQLVLLKRYCKQIVLRLNVFAFINPPPSCVFVHGNVLIYQHIYIKLLYVELKASLGLQSSTLGYLDFGDFLETMR